MGELLSQSVVEEGGGSPAPRAVRMAALSLLLHQVMQRRPHPDHDADAWTRMGRDFAELMDGIFGGDDAVAGRPPPPGGLGAVIAGTAGLLEALRRRGMSREIESWISNRPNLPADPEQLARVLDDDELTVMARQAGADRDTLLVEVARLLPDFVHRMTPEGRLPGRESEVPGGLGGLLGGLLEGGEGVAQHGRR
ncbi:MAG: YidB family protein [Acetobacteraceae bacterium]|nr:YidB family protein [Acetobacteraceae bacterium]